jgi:hypothetical protein
MITLEIMKDAFKSTITLNQSDIKIDCPESIKEGLLGLIESIYKAIPKLPSMGNVDLNVAETLINIYGGKIIKEEYPDKDSEIIY